MTLLLGCIADDFTGATDLAGMLVRAGMRTVQMIGVPQAPLAEVADDVDAVVVALKSRTTSPADAVADSLAALAWLQQAGCRQVYFKYCSTFDSTDRGNIGPVTDALMTALNTSFTIACPAFPENKRTVFKGHLFVGDALLSDSGMRDHPLTPMTDSNLVRVLQRQTGRKVGLINHEVVGQGAAAIVAHAETLRADGIEIAIVDAVSNADLMQIGAACANLPLVTAGSGVALGLPQNFSDAGLLAHASSASALPPATGHRAVIAGSCSLATQAQVAHAIDSGMPAFAIDPRRLAAGDDAVSAALAWAAPRLEAGPVLVYATANPEQVRAAQTELGVERAGLLVERALADIAKGLVELGVRQLIVAGGETSGAVVSALQIEGLRIGPQIDPGVPWTASLERKSGAATSGKAALCLALKSGNFGSTDFFTKAWSVLQ